MTIVRVARAPRNTELSEDKPPMARIARTRPVMVGAEAEEPVIAPDKPPMARIARTRPVPVAPEPVPPQRVRRANTIKAKPWSSKPRYIVDFGLPWGSLFQLYLMNSYLYYQMNRTVISDHDYDKLCNVLLAGWKTAKHQHKHLISESDLRATTGYAIDYPTVVMSAATMLLDHYREI